MWQLFLIKMAHPSKHIAIPVLASRPRLLASSTHGDMPASVLILRQASSTLDAATMPLPSDAGSPPIPKAIRTVQTSTLMSTTIHYQSMTFMGYLRKQDGFRVMMTSKAMRKDPSSIHFRVRIFRAPCKPSVGYVRQVSDAQQP